MTELTFAALNFGQGGFQKSLELLAGEGVDVVGCQEGGGSAKRKAINGFKKAFGWFTFHPRVPGGAAAVPLLARPGLSVVTTKVHKGVPRRRVGPLGAGPTTIKAKRINRQTVNVDGQLVHGLSTHYIASATRTKKWFVAEARRRNLKDPVKKGEGEWRRRRKHHRDHSDALIALARELSKTGIVVVMVDVNAPPDHALVKRLHNAGFVGWSNQPTKGKRPIDQVLIFDGDAEGVQHRVVKVPGSDHDSPVKRVRW